MAEPQSHEFLPAYVRPVLAGFRKFRGFLHETGFPGLAEHPIFAVRDDAPNLIASYLASGSERGLASWIADQVAAVHTGAAFARHAEALREKEPERRIPRMRDVLPPLPDLAVMQADVQRELAAALQRIPHEQVDALLRHVLRTGLFAEAFGRQSLGNWLEDFFHAQRSVAQRMLEWLDTPEAVGPERQMLLDIAVRHYLQVRYFERAYDLLSRAAARRPPGREIDTRFMEGLWYTAFRLGRREEARGWLREWARIRPLLRQPLVNQAVLAAYDDKEEACRMLEKTGVLHGRSTVAGQVLYGEYNLELGRTHQAEMTIRHAIDILQTPEQPAPVDFFITLHNVLSVNGGQTTILREVFRRYEMELAWEEFGIDTVADLSRDVEAPPARVAVVMTAFNAQDHIARAIEGVLGQSVPGVRLIVVDDCSGDGTAAICAPLAEAGRLTYLRTPRNVGTYAAKNLGIAEALREGCDYVALCDSDDFWLRTHVAHHLRAMQGQPELKCTTSQWLRIRSDGTIECGLRGRYIEECPHSTFFAADVFEKVGLFDSVRFGADREFQQRVRLHFGSTAQSGIGMVLTLGRRHGLSLTQHGAGAISQFSESPMRIAYWKAWNEWHDVELAAGRVPRTDGAPENRPFPVPDDMLP
ncbi:glycosyltransferase family 2 protein [Ancylobacter oerskovii]|uniref:Glycosyltransferase family 2 protein n=1 Tax=Ancylobacter oerskovii TaxID=459519 RepID=A0ABW4Z0K3_9HYPH|nr:glycosyltransferase family A protein [Ancylobacter oerskovii]MBS7542742.1 glycosyltransferase family 2 protein [Ancylobacter oerskovii]